MFNPNRNSFAHKTNPHNQARSTKSMALPKNCQGLSLNCTSEGKKLKQAVEWYILVAIANGKRVVYNM